MKQAFLIFAAAWVGAAQAQSPASTDRLRAFDTALDKAQALSVQYTVQPIGKAMARFTVTLSKPNLARIDKPTELVVADGTNITVYRKKENRYYSKPQTKDLLLSHFDGDETMLWKGFFGESAFAKLVGRSGATVNRKGMELQTVKATLDARTGKIATLYLAPSDNIVRQATIDQNAGGATTTVVLDTVSVSMAKPQNDVFAWKAPANSSVISEDELTGANWLYDLDEAFKLAEKTGKIVMVHFTADWCTWCRKIEAEVYSSAEFKSRGKDFVFVQIDTDKNKTIAQRYEVGGIPDIRFLAADGTELNRVLGYKPKPEFLAEMDKAKAAK